MEELWAAIVVVDHVNGGQVMRALYDRAGDEPKRPVRRRVAAAMRWVAERLAPLPEVKAVAPTVVSEGVVAS